MSDATTGQQATGHATTGQHATGQQQPAGSAQPDRTIVFALGTAPKDGATVAAMRLAEEAVQRGHRVAVYAYGDGVRIGAAGCPSGAYVEELVRSGVHGGRAAWVVDREDPRTTTQVPGVVLGDGSDLWRFVREADVVLGVTA